VVSNNTLTANIASERGCVRTVIRSLLLGRSEDDFKNLIFFEQRKGLERKRNSCSSSSQPKRKKKRKERKRKERKRKEKEKRKKKKEKKGREGKLNEKK
jgi:hypothetical protein